MRAIWERTSGGTGVAWACLHVLGLVLGFVLVLVLAALCALCAVLLVHLGRCPDIYAAPVVSAAAAPWRDGDLVLTQAGANGLAAYPVVNRVLVHAGLVWVHPTLGPCVVETSGGPLPDALSGTAKTGVRVCRVPDYVAECAGGAWRRALCRGQLDAAALAAAVAWAYEQPFDAYVHGVASPAWVLAISASAAAPALSRFIATHVVPSHDAAGARLRGVYCSELVAELLKRAGGIDAAFDSHLCYAGGFTSTHRQLDDRALNGIAWGPEERLAP